MSASTQQFSAFPVREVMCVRSGCVDVWVMPGKSCAGWVCCVSSHALPKCFIMATMQKLTEWAINEVILESDIDAHSSEDEEISPQRTPTMAATKRHYLHKPHTVDWEYTLSTFCIYSLQEYRALQLNTTHKCTPFWVQYSTVQYERWCSDPALQLFPVSCATLCLSIQQVLRCSKRCQESPGFKKWWPRSLHLHTASASQSWKTCDEVSNAYLHLPHLGPSTSPILNRCPFKRQGPVSSPVIILSWFLLRLSKSPAF